MFADEDLLARARATAKVAAEYADASDREGRFPTEAIESAKENKLLGLLVPEADGGEGRSIGEVADVIRIISGACANTGMVLAMHHNQAAGVVRHGTTPEFAERRRRLVTEQLVVASATTEKGIGGDTRRSTCAVAEEGESFDLVKDAPVISYAEHCDALMVTARKNPDAAANDQVLVWLEGDAMSLERTGDWDTLGLRGTCSNGYLLKAHGRRDAIMPESFERISAHTMLPCAHVLWASVWLGIAEQAVLVARKKVQKSGRSNPNALPPGALRLAETEVELQKLRGAVEHAARVVDTTELGSPELEAIPFAIEMNSLKVLASTAAVDLVGRAMVIVGIDGYRLNSKVSLARSLRDIYGSMLMVNNDRILNHTSSLEMIHRGEAHE